MSDFATLDIAGNIATLTLNRPDKRNAMSIDLLDALRAHVKSLAGMGGGGPSVLMITGAGKSFSAGMDLKAVLDEPGAPERLLGSIAELTLEVRALPMVVVGKVNGAAIGGGCGLVAVCDIAVTHPDAKLGYPEVDLGVCPAVVAPWLVRKVGAGVARRILLSGGTMSGHNAHRLGLVDQLAEREELDAHVDALCERLAAAGPHALSVTKGLLNELESAGLADAVRKGAKLSADVVGGEEARSRLAKIYGS